MTHAQLTAATPEQAPFPPRRTASRPRPAPILRWGITAKLGLLAGGLVLVLVTAGGALLLQTGETTHEYDHLLAAQVNEGLAARRIQVEFKRQVQEWKDILLRGSDPDDLTTYTANFRKQDGIVRALTDDLIARTTDPRVRADLTAFRTQHQQLDTAYERALSGFVAGGGRDFATADRLVRGQDRPPTALLDGVVTRLGDTITARVAEQKATAADRQRLGLIAGLVLLGVLAVLVSIVVRRLVRPIRGLTSAARLVAEESLPGVITQITSMPPHAEPPSLPAYQVNTRDELKDLAEAFTQVQDSAVRLATEQHRAEREAAEMLINLGRRNQNLLGRLLSQVSELERSEQDPEVLDRLFRLDHAATRIRRNAESMLVLAGAPQTRTFCVPVPFEDVIRAALSEIEDYVRVDLYHIEDGMISGSAAADVVHLLAELIENATNFSPPHNQVTVVGQRIREGYRIRVIDQGVGMTQRELTEANEHILRATRGRSDAKLLGLYVVGRLATRRGIEVTLEPSAARGITATVLIPAATMADRHRAPGPSPEALPSPTGPVSLNGAGRRPPTTPTPSAPTGSAPAPALPSPHVADPASRPGPTDPSPLPRAGRPRPAAAAAPGGPLPRPAASGASGAPDAGLPVMPKRVRGAQLAGLDLGDSAPERAFAPAPESSRWNLRSLQLDVEAARRMIADPGGADPGGSDLSDGRHVIDVTVHDRSHDHGREGR
jgi:HAMP domain-containing protein